MVEWSSGGHHQGHTSRIHNKVSEGNYVKVLPGGGLGTYVLRCVIACKFFSVVSCKNKDVESALEPPPSPHNHKKTVARTGKETP